METANSKCEFRATVKWMDRYLLGKGNDAPGNSIMTGWMRVRAAQKSFFWVISEAVRLNELLTADNETLSDQFLIEYVLTISDGCGLDLSLRPEQLPFVEKIITHLIDFNGPQDMTTNAKLRGILNVIRSTTMV